MIINIINQGHSISKRSIIVKIDFSIWINFGEASQCKKKSVLENYFFDISKNIVIKK